MPDHQVLTAELCARAIVASAKSYGDDPLRVMATQQGLLRRSIIPAGLAIAQATGTPLRDLGALLRFNPAKRHDAERNGGDRYRAALTAALLAIGGAALALAPEKAVRSKPQKRAVAPAPVLAPKLLGPAISSPAPELAVPIAPAPERIEGEKSRLDMLRAAVRAHKSGRRCPESIQVAGRAPEPCGVLLTGDQERCRLHTPRRVVGRGKSAEGLVRSVSRVAP